jgi:hypothetical protein
MGKTSRATTQMETVILFLVGAAFLATGLIFLCAAAQNTARLPIALALAIIGAGIAAWAGFRWQRARQLSPEVLDDRITVLAANHEAEVSLAQVVSALNVPDEAARSALARLEAGGLCIQEHRNGQILYVFPGLKERKVVRRCSYCGSEYSVREPLTKCTNCGGTLEIVKI